MRISNLRSLAGSLCWQAPGKRGCWGCPRDFFVMLFYINNDDKKKLRGMYFFISFIVSFSRYFSLQITILNSPMAFMHLAKVAQNWHIHLTSRAFGQCPVGRCWIVKYGPAARLKWNKKGRGAGKKRLWERTAYIEKLSSRNQKVFPKPYCINDRVHAFSWICTFHYDIRIIL